MNNLGLVSIVVPIYKAENTLNKCVESIVNQTYENLDIILVDDGSPDKCPQMCDEWAHRDSRIRVIHKELDHVCEARNAGLQATKGDYVIQIDSDDYIESNMIESMIKKAESTNADIVICSVIGHHFDGTLEVVKPYTFEVTNGESVIKRIFTTAECGYALWNKLIRKDLIVKTGARFKRMSGKYSEDALFLITNYAFANKVVSINDHFYHYIIAENSTSHGGKLSEARVCDWVNTVGEFLCEIEKMPLSNETINIVNFAFLKYLFYLQYISYINCFDSMLPHIEELIEAIEIKNVKCKWGNSIVFKIIKRKKNRKVVKIVHKLLVAIKAYDY